MIIWLASYPKSGNTFLRTLLTSYLFTNDGKFDENKMDKINQFPDVGLFRNLGIDPTNDEEVVKNYIKHVIRLSPKYILLRNLREGKQKKTYKKTGVLEQTKKNDF